MVLVPRRNFVDIGTIVLYDRDNRCVCHDKSYGSQTDSGVGTVNYTRLFSMIYRKSQVFYARELKAHGISSGQFMYILCICENPGLTQEALGRELQFDKGSVANTVAQLLREGFITRRVSPEDRRAYNLFPTDKAAAVYPAILAVQEKWHRSLTRELTDVEQDILDRLLEKIPIDPV